MDRRSWLWRRKSSEKSPGETESSGSISSERYSDDHENLRASPNNASPNSVQSLEVSSKVDNNEVHETMKSLTEKLSAALLSINAKDDLVKQHAKVAEEAVSGWEKAELEVVALKQQLEAAAKKNSALEDRVGHLDGALKECVRELRVSREEQEQKIQDAIVKKAQDWEVEKSEFEGQLSELRTQLEAAKAEVASSVDHDLQSKLEASETKNSALKDVWLAQSKNLKTRTLERDLSIQAAETASKQLLESIKKVAKLEAECRRLRCVERKTPLANDRRMGSSICMESVTDSQSDSGEQLLGLENEGSCSGSWATALIAELDQFKSNKVGTRSLATSVEIELMDDFLEMERLVGLPEADSSEGNSKVETQLMHQQITDLVAKIEKMENKKAELEVALTGTRKQLDSSTNQMRAAEAKITELQRQLDLADRAKQLSMIQLIDAEEKRKALESQFELAQSQVNELSGKLSQLEANVDEERALSAELTAKLDAADEAKQVLESQLLDKISILEGEIEEKKAKSAEYTASAGALEAAKKELEASKKELEIQLESTKLEVRKLHVKVTMLEQEIKEERILSAESIAKLENAEADRKTAENQLEVAQQEVGKLHDKITSLEKKIDDERSSCEALVTKCQNLEDELSSRKRETEFRRARSSNEEMKLKQEKDFAMAAGKLAECQKTIASLNRHLQLLTALDDLMLESEMPELNDRLPDLRTEDGKELSNSDSSADTENSTVPNGKTEGTTPCLVPRLPTSPVAFA
ncbi:filament-like plant protein 3 isoform X2 [Dioscorea cayenensis subsp. rotundata]|uniref:Filament-like plant protein 3 isoform X2 n=1 Tax=Dioscorea cayennensis subsp. rotundata TaxID=55577 RepID=A0AB40C2N3_DIOCR|nr:filament-like plant protein 3 isoform X2 [Dioscorea cayenensis subsp. rotundata]